MTKRLAALCVFCLTGCAEREIHIFDAQGKLIGGCSAGYDWHYYGLQDSIDYMLYQCVKASRRQGVDSARASDLRRVVSMKLNSIKSPRTRSSCGLVNKVSTFGDSLRATCDFSIQDNTALAATAGRGAT